MLYPDKIPKLFHDILNIFFCSFSNNFNGQLIIQRANHVFLTKLLSVCEVQIINLVVFTEGSGLKSTLTRKVFDHVLKSSKRF